MTKKIILIICLIVCFGSAKSQDVKLGKSSVDDVIKAMTLEEKAQLLVGTGMAGFSGNNAVVGSTQSLVPGAAGTTYPVPRLGIPAIVLADGPAGLRISPKRDGSDDTYYCTAFPVATALASTWNAELVENVGLAMGNEVLEYGADVLLGPALNIHRNPLCGRNFEYFSEDPLLTGKIAAAIVRGIQKNNVGTSIKHYAANNQESNRMSNDARITVRALREIYLKGFEIAVKESNPWTVMTSYNYINGVYASESRELLTTILRDEWKYKGTVMTDWGGGRNAPAQVHAGNDLLMPGRTEQSNAIVQAVKDGKLSEEDVDVNVRRILNLVLISPRFKEYKYSNKPDLKAHAETTRQSATEGIILLKNNSALPLTSAKKIATFGVTSYDFISGGTGSGDVNEAYTISLGEGLVNTGYQINEELKSLYLKYIADENEKNKPDPSNRFAMFMPKVRPGEFVPDANVLNKTAKETDVALITIGRTSGEFLDRKLDNDFNLSETEQKLIKDVCETFHAANKKVVVILNIGGVIETASWKQYPDAIVLAWQPGQEGGNSVADILCGKVNPSGKLPMTFPVKYEDIASSANFPLNYVSQMNFFGNNAQNDNKPQVKDIDYTNYEEDIYVGYRYFGSFDKEVSYPFGYGLSYTTFDYENPQVKQTGTDYIITVTVKNTGTITGKEVVQLYVSAPKNDKLPKPAKELKAFAKTKNLKPDETQNIGLKINVHDLASFDESESAWVTDTGEYKLLISASSDDIKQTLNLTVSEKIVEKTHDVMKSQHTINVLKKY
ncbi:MAG: glycoside hydrolase family 3 C-terminal domain-containing protein [Prevotellaceae bacterium]|jgi:beta-glucosidase|nr:glycoside hydrolase family 3 C-terminal domain-containing protein [Prevotellaceae bacterium]